MDNFVILQQMVAIDRAQNRFELRASIQTLLRIIGSCTSSERVIFLTGMRLTTYSATHMSGAVTMCSHGLTIFSP